MASPTPEQRVDVLNNLGEKSGTSVNAPSITAQSISQRSSTSTRVNTMAPTPEPSYAPDPRTQQRLRGLNNL